MGAYGCPAGAQLEGEPLLTTDYVDTYNGGCGESPNTAIQHLHGDENGELEFCGHAGCFPCGEEICRDTDWFAVYKADEECRISGRALVSTQLSQLTFDPAQRCSGPVTITQTVELSEWETVTLDLAGDVGSEIWVSCVGLQGDHSFEYPYWLEFHGIGGVQTVSEEDPPPPSKTTWSSIKLMFR